MPQIINRVYATSTDIVSPFSLTTVDGYEITPDGVKAYYIIEQKSNKSIYARVSGTVSGQSLTVNTVEYTTEDDDGIVDTGTKQLPTFSGTVNIFSTLPLTKMQRGEGQDGILIVGDGNAVGLNGIVYSSTGGWSDIMDFPDPRVMQYRQNGIYPNADHTALEPANPDIVDKVVLAQEPLCHSFDTNGFPEANSVGFGISFGKEYVHNYPGARQVVLLPAGDSTQGFDASFDGTTRNNSIALCNEFLNLDLGKNTIECIIICMGSVDGDTMTNGVFSTNMTELIDYYRDSSRFPSVPIVVVGLSFDHTGGQTTNVNAAIAALPGLRFGVGYAAPTAAMNSDTSGVYLNGPGQRLLGKVIYSAFVTATENTKLT